MADGGGDIGKTQELDALIIGAGFGGLYQLHLLRDRLGLNAQVVEKATGVGGTWWWNRYPGARCDSESHAYAYLFSEALHRGWQWSERYPGHAEIRRYLNYVADELDLKRDIRFGVEVVSADYQGRWIVRTADGQSFSTRYLITAVGCLSTANIPDIPGLEDFRGEWRHTGAWPHEGVDFTGKRVGQIGTGSTGIQAAPVIAAEAEHLTVFQRTPNYSVPARNAPLTDEAKAEIREDFEGIRALTHRTPNGHPFEISQTQTHEVSDAERLEEYERRWDKGGLRFRGAFQNLLMNKEANDTAANFLKAKIRGVVKDPDTADKLANIDHPYGAKRPPIDTTYFETFNRPNVSLVDVRAHPIQRITETGIETAEGNYDLDVIVFATGFDAMTGPLLGLNLTGKNGVSLRDAWAAGPRTYLGVQIKDFPNLFTVTGPGSPSVLCNMPVCIEQHVEWIADCIEHLEATGAGAIEPSETAVEEWVAHVNDAANATLLPTVKHSWYLGANVPGKPRVFMPYAGGMVRYRNIANDIAADGYRGFEIDGEAASGVALPQDIVAAGV